MTNTDRLRLGDEKLTEAVSDALEYAVAIVAQHVVEDSDGIKGICIPDLDPYAAALDDVFRPVFEVESSKFGMTVRGYEFTGTKEELKFLCKKI